MCFVYDQEYYKEILNKRAFTSGDLLAQVGGYVGKQSICYDYFKYSIILLDIKIRDNFQIIFIIHKVCSWDFRSFKLLNG